MTLSAACINFDGIDRGFYKLETGAMERPRRNGAYLPTAAEMQKHSSDTEVMMNRSPSIAVV